MATSRRLSSSAAASDKPSRLKLRERSGSKFRDQIERDATAINFELDVANQQPPDRLDIWPTPESFIGKLASFETRLPDTDEVKHCPLVSWIVLPLFRNFGELEIAVASLAKASFKV